MLNQSDNILQWNNTDGSEPREEMHEAESRRGLNPEFPTGMWNVLTFPGIMWDNGNKVLLFSRSVVSDSLGPHGLQHANQQSSPKARVFVRAHIDLNGHPHCWLQYLAPLEVSLVPHDPKPPPREPHCWTVAISLIIHSISRVQRSPPKGKSQISLWVWLIFYHTLKLYSLTHFFLLPHISVPSFLSPNPLRFKTICVPNTLFSAAVRSGYSL